MLSVKKNIQGFFKVSATRSFVLWFYCIGLLGLTLPFIQDYFANLVSWSLLFIFLLLMLFHKGEKTIRFTFCALFVGIGAFLIELHGVQSGSIFGHYQYGKGFGIKVLDTPLLIAVNWLMLIYLSYYIAGKISSRFVFHIFISASLMVLYDFFLEPVAVHMDWWQWEDGVIPLKNYLAWFLLSLVFAGLFKLCKIQYENALAWVLFFSQLGFLLLIQMLFKMIHP
jgi:bisanhydrobacterioruberin hydratase